MSKYVGVSKFQVCAIAVSDCNISGVLLDAGPAHVKLAVDSSAQRGFADLDGCFKGHCPSCIASCIAIVGPNRVKIRRNSSKEFPYIAVNSC